MPHEVRVVSAHRTPHLMAAYAQQAAGRGLKVIIAGAGGAAHLPGMVASMTTLPVIGVPVPLKYLDGMDSLLSIVQMPAGVRWRPCRSAARATPACSRCASWPPPTTGWPAGWPAFQHELAQLATDKDAALQDRLAGGPTAG